MDLAMDGLNPADASNRRLDPEALLADRRWLVALARGLLHGDAVAAEDVAQETELRAWQRPAPDPSRRGGWLRRIAHNVASRMRSSDLARVARERTAATKEGLPATDDLVARVHVQRAVADAVLALAEPYRTAVLLRFFDGLPPRAIAAKHAVPVETVRTRLKRALDQLRAKLDHEYGRRDAWAAVLLVPWAAVTVTLSTSTKLALAAAIVVAGTVAWRHGLWNWFDRAQLSQVESPIDAADLAPPNSHAHDVRSDVEPSRVATQPPTDVVPQPTLLVRVTDEQGAPVVARIYAGKHDDVDFVAATSGDGSARVTPKDDWNVLVATAPKRQPAEVSIPSSRPDSITMTTRQGSTIHGVVKFGTGDERVTAGIRVMAVASGLLDEHTLAHMVAVRDGRAIGPIVSTNADGEFTLDGLDGALSYHLFAGSRGMVTLPDQDPVPADCSEATVRVGMLYGLEFEVRQHGGSPLPEGDWFGPPIFFGDDQEERDTIHSPHAAVASGLSPNTFDLSHRRFVALKYGTDPKIEEIGPYAHHFTAAGFVGKTAKEMLPRVEDALAKRCVELDPLEGVRFGRLTVEIHGEDDALRTGAREGILGQITLNSTTDSKLDTESGWVTGVRFGRGRELVVDGVPCGPYTWYFQPRHGGYQRPIVELGQKDNSKRYVTVDGDDARIVLDLTDCGDLEIDLVHADGTACLHHVILEVEPVCPTRGRGRFFGSCNERPQLLAALLTGHYRARVVEHDRRNDLDSAPLAEFEVLPGALVRLRLVVPEARTE